MPTTPTDRSCVDDDAPRHFPNLYATVTDTTVLGLFDAEESSPDDMADALPHGFAAIRGACWMGAIDAHPLIELRLSLGGMTIDATLNADQAEALIAALGEASDAAVRFADASTGEDREADDAPDASAPEAAR